jgi:hypothetical protein
MASKNTLAKSIKFLANFYISYVTPTLCAGANLMDMEKTSAISLSRSSKREYTSHRPPRLNRN